MLSVSRAVVVAGRSLMFGLALLAVVGSRPAHAQTAIGLEGALFFDDATREDDERIGPIRDQHRDAVSNVDVPAVALTFLVQLGSPEVPRSGFRVGGELRYLGEYATEPDEGDEDARILGTLLELGVRGDWSLPLTAELAFVAGLRADLALVFPGGDLADEIDRLSAEGVSTGHGPRPGITIIPSMGARYAVHERLAVHLTAGLGYAVVGVFDLDETVQGVAYRRSESISSTRFELALGLELTL